MAGMERLLATMPAVELQLQPSCCPSPAPPAKINRRQAVPRQGGVAHECVRLLLIAPLHLLLPAAEPGRQGVPQQGRVSQGAACQHQLRPAVSSPSVHSACRCVHFLRVGRAAVRRLSAGHAILAHAQLPAVRCPSPRSTLPPCCSSEPTLRRPRPPLPLPMPQQRHHRGVAAPAWHQR